MLAVATSKMLPAARLALCRIATGLCMGWFSAAILAAEAPAHRFAAPTVSTSVPAPAAGLLQVTLSLIVVLAAVFAAAWLLRRVRMLGGKNETGAAITVVAERAVGPRERVVLLQVGDARVLVGVAAGSVRPLHVFAGPLSAGAEVTIR